MNTGQMILTVGAMILLSTLILRINTTSLNSLTTTDDSKFEILGASLASSMIEEATGAAFDSASASGPVSSLAQLTSPNALGPDPGDSYPYFDDIDDFNGFVKVDSTLPSAVFKIAVKVDYVSPNNPQVTSSVATWTKRISVTVTSKSMSDTVHLSTLYSYWVFR